MSNAERSGLSVVVSRTWALSLTAAGGWALHWLVVAALVATFFPLAAQAAPLLDRVVLNAPEAPAVAAPAAGPAATSAPVAPAPAGEPAATTPAVPAKAEEPLWPTVSLDTSFFSKYVWRGLVLTDGPVWQPSVTAEWQGLSLNVWGNLDFDDVNHLSGEFNEVDWTLGYEHQIVGPLSGSLGLIVYEFPNTAFKTTTEITTGLALDVPLAPSLTAYFDVDQTDGVYLLAEVAHSIELPKFAENVTAAVDLGAGLGWGSAKNNASYFGVKSAAVTDYYLSVGLPIAIGDHLTITPSVKYTSIVNGNLREGVLSDDNVVYGISLTWSF